MKKYFYRLLLMVMFIPWVVQAQTTPAPASLPYTCGFEDATENANWVIENGASATNKFFIGTAVNNGGTKSLYVSDDNGVSNSYTSSATDAGYVYAYREFTITSTGGYSIAFDWRAKGESTYDFLRVFLIPDNAADALTPSTGTSAHTGIAASASPASWMAIDNGVKLNLKETWQSFVSEDLQLTPGTYKLVFYWRTDLSGTYDPPVAVDNVIFTEVTCPRPFNFAATTILDNSATFSWVSESSSFAYHCDTANAPRQWFNTASIVNGNTLTLNGLTPNTAYTLYLQTMCGSDTSLWVSLNFRTACTPIASENIPYHESFESWASGAFDPCYVATNNNTSATNYPSVSTTYHSDSAKSMYMYSTAAYATWLTMPMFESPLNTLQVSFDLYRANATVYPFMVGVMSDPNDMSTFDTITTISCRTNNEWEHFTIPLSIYNGQGTFITFVSPSGVVSQNYIDNIVVEELAACPDPINVTAYATSEQDVTIAWTETGATGYVAEYGLMGFTRGMGTLEYGLQDSINLYGLDPATAYDVYLRADCGGDTGNWIGPLTVRTACPEVVDISELSYVENFDSYVAVTNTTSYSADNNLPSCWDFYSNGTAGATAAYWPRIYKGTSYCPTSNDNALLMYICNYSGTTASSLGYVAERGTEKMAVLPLVSEYLNNVTISFDARVYTVSASVVDTIFVAIATSDSTYIPLAHFEGVSGLQSIEVNLASYSSIIDNLTIENPRIAIVFKASTYTTTSLRSNYLGIDNVTIAKNSPCIHPYAAEIIGVTENSVTFNFADSADVANYEITWATANDVLLATDVETHTDTTGTIYNLTPNTEYFAWVRANCGSGTYSSWEAFGSFRTLCTAVDSLPYAEDFENYATGTTGTMNTCWTKGTNYTTAYPYVNTNNNSKRLYFYSTVTYYSYAALPLFTAPLNTLQISFDLVKYSTYTADLVLGVMSNPQDISTFVAIDTIVPEGSANTINSYEISLEPYANLQGCIAFLSPNTATDYSYLDNVVVSELPACRKSVDLVASNIAANTATLSWYNTTGDSYIVAYSRDANFDPDTCTAVVATTADSVAVTGLRPYSNYYFAVKAICGIDTGAWSFERGEFQTIVDCGTAELEEPIFGTGTTTSSTYPMYSSSSYAKGRTWTIYTREELGREGIYGGNINSVAYQYTTTTPMPVDVNVYIAETNLNTMAVADTIAFSQMTQVFSGRLTFTADQDWNTIIFDNAFNYSGDSNLMIAVERVSSVSTTGYFKYTAGIGNKAIYSYINSSGSKYAYTTVNRANIKFNICNVIPACAYPRDVVVSNITTTTADIAWNHTATNFTVAYGPVGFDLDSTATYQTVQANATSITLTGLTQNTDYDVYVRANCSATETSDWSFVESFNTPCEVISTLPYIENFDSYTTGVVTGTTAPTGYPNHVLPSCWNIYPLSETTSTYPQSFLTSSTTYAQEGNALFFKSAANSSIFAVMPEVTVSIDSLMLTFAYRNEGTTASNGTLSLGVMSDIFDTTTFIELESYPMTTTITNVEHMFSADTITFTNNHVIAFRYKGGTSNNYYMAIDNVVLDRRPACLPPVNVDVIDSTITLTSAEVKWTNREGTSWVIEYGPEGFELGQGTRVAANTNPFTITGLTHSTRYDVYVRAILNADSSAYSLDPATFKTTCGVIDSLPWTANLDGVWYYYTNNTTALYPMCWDVIDNGYVNSSGTHYNWRRTTTASYIRTGTAAIQFAGVTNTTSGSVHNDYLITPELQLTGNEQLVFWMRNSSSTTTAGTYDARVAIYALTSNSTDFVQISPRITMVGGQATYTEHIVPLTGLTGNVKLAFVVDTNSYSFYIDDVTVEPIPSCPKPRFVTVDSVSRTSVSLSWKNNATEFIVDYKKSADTVWSTMTGIYDTTVTVINLLPSSTYQFRVKAVCMVGDSSVWSEIAEGATECGTVSLPFAENFSGTTFAPNCWNIYSGRAFVDTLASTTGIWTRLTTNNGIQGPHARLNIYGTSRKHWLVTPEIDLANESGAELSFDLALTDYSNGDTIESTNTDDDKFMVIISRDGGNTWLRENATVWSDLASDSADYSYRGIRKTAQRITIDLAQYYGDTIKVAFYGESTVTGGDNDLHIGNILIESGCPAPIIATVTNDATTATISWTSTATDFQVAYREVTAADWSTPIDVTNATTYTFTGLMPETDYVLGVRTICGEGTVSGWATTTITTPELPCIAPTNVTATNITYTSANIGWTASGNEVSWEVRYATAGREDTIVTTDNPVTIDNLYSGDQYQVWVRAFCGAETYSEWSEVYTFNTLSCATVSNVAVSEISGNNATVTWTPAEGQTAWEVTYGMQGFTEGNGIATVIVTNPTYQMTGLETLMSYDVYVRALCGEGVYSAWSQRVTFTTTEDECENVSNVAAGDITENSATITWTPAGDETKWQVAYCLASDATVVGEDATIVDVENTPSYTITGLESRTSYDAFVRNVCGETNYSAWVKVNFTTNGIGINTAANDNVSVSIYPNPANTQATVSVEGIEGKVEFVLADMNGRIIVTETINCNGQLVKTIDVSNMAKGAYFVHIYNDNFNTTRKLIVK